MRERNSRMRAVDEGVPENEWRRVSWVTPILSSWQAIVAILAVLIIQNIEVVQDVAEWETFQENMLSVILWFFAGAGLLLLLIMGFAYLSWRAMTYAVTDGAVWLRKGILFRSQRHVRFERIQAVDLVHPLLGRIFGLGNLTVEVAGGSGSNLVIGFLPTKKLAALRAEILARAAGVYPEDSATVESGEQALEVQISEAPENELYAVPAGRLVGSVLLSGSSLFAIFLMIAAVVGAILAAVLSGPELVFGMLSGLIPLVIGLAAMFWTRFAGEFNFRAAVSPDGIRIRRGLTESRAETIPPRRVHAVKITQPFLWRKFGWYRVTISQASKTPSNDGSNTASAVLLPVGDKQQALLALWLVIPDLAVEDPVKLFDEALHGRGNTPGFIGVPPKARLFDPMVYKRSAMMLTDTSVVVRTGRVARRATFVSYERIQSLICSQGPWDRARGLSNLQLAIVPGTIWVRQEHLASSDAARAAAVITERSNSLRLTEPPEKWLERIEVGLGVDLGSKADTDPDLTGDVSVLEPAEVQGAPAHSAEPMGFAEDENDRWKP